MNDIIPRLTPDERSVLEIAMRGESLAAIGRWEPAIDHLVELGLLHRLNRSNNLITAEGRKVWETIEDEPYRDLALTLQRTAQIQKSCALEVQKAADLIVEASRRAAQATGGTPLAALDAWLKEVRDECSKQLGVT